jgi:hypothetical protein
LDKKLGHVTVSEKVAIESGGRNPFPSPNTSIALSVTPSVRRTRNDRFDFPMCPAGWNELCRSARANELVCHIARFSCGILFAVVLVGWKIG